MRLFQRRRLSAVKPGRRRPAATVGLGRHLANLRVGVAVEPLEHIAHEAGMTPGLLARIERGETAPTLAEVVRLAVVLAHHCHLHEDDLLVDLAIRSGHLPAQTTKET